MCGFGSQFRVRKKSKNAQAIIRADQHHAAPGQTFAVENGLRRSPREITAPMNPQHYRLGRLRRPFRRPDVEIQTILAAAADVLHASRAEGRSVANARPWFDLPGFAPAQITNGRRRKRDAFENGTAAQCAASNFSGSDGHGWRFLGQPCKSDEHQRRKELGD